MYFCTYQQYINYLSMEYRFVHYWQYELGAEDNEILDKAVTLVNKPRTDGFLKEVTLFISRYTGAEFVTIGLISEDKRKINTCIFLHNENELQNFTYSLYGTPCDAVLSRKFCYFPTNVADSFPNDHELQQMEIESYLGSLFMKEDNEVLGLIALMSSKTIENAAFAEHLILVLSQAIEEELLKIAVLGDKEAS